MAFVQICELGYCPYKDLYPLRSTGILTCDDCPHSVYADETEGKASSGGSQLREGQG